MAEQLQLLDVGNIKPAKWNRSVGDVDELAESIKDIGLVEPIVVRPQNGSFELVAGERRWTAAVAAGLTEIPTIVRELDDRQALEMQLVENLHRKDLEPLEEAQGYARLVELGYKQAEVAQKVKRSAAHVSKRIALLELPAVAQKRLSVGKLTVENALDLLLLKDHPKRLEKLLAGSHYGGLGYAVRGELSRIKSSEKHAAAKKRLKDAGVKVVGRPSYNSKTKSLTSEYDGLGLKIGEHKNEPCHAAYIEQYNQKVVYVCTDPSRHAAKGESAVKSTTKAADDSARRTRETAQQTKKRERLEREAAAIAEATSRRRAFIVELVTNIRGKKISKDQLHEHTARAIAFGDIGYGTEEAAALALGVMKPPEEGPRTRIRHRGVNEITPAVHAYCGTSTSNLTRYAFTVALFAGEALLEEMRRTWNPMPKGAADWHLDFLVGLGYEISDVETKAYRAKEQKS